MSEYPRSHQCAYWLPGRNCWPFVLYLAIVTACKSYDMPWRRIASSSPCLQGKLAKPAVPWIIFPFALKCFSLTFTHVLLRQNIWTSFDDKFEDHIEPYCTGKLKTKQPCGLLRLLQFRLPSVTAWHCSLVAGSSSSPVLNHSAASAVQAGSRCWRNGRANASQKIWWCRWRQNTSMSDDMRWPNANASCVCVI